MDKDGFVPVTVIVRFNRVRALTQDTALIKEVSLTAPHSAVFLITPPQSLDGSEVVEMADSGDRLRQKVGWQRWIFTGLCVYKKS